MTLPSDEIMETMSQLALKKATSKLAEMAVQIAVLCKGLDGEETLLRFAKAIRETNENIWPPTDGPEN